MHRSRGPAVAAALVAGLSSSAPARADLASDRARVEAAFRESGLEVATLPTRFLWDDEVLTVRLPAKAAPCTTVALIAPRGSSYRARLAGLDDREGRDRGASIAGVAELVRCDVAPVEQVVVTGDAGRGALEVVVGHGALAAPPLRSVLPERTGGVVVTTSEPGPQPALPPLARRVEGAELRARGEGAKLRSAEPLTARADGTGLTEIDLTPGCHRLSLMAHERDAPGKARFDVDAELRDADDETLLARDRSEAADARLYACVGVPVLGALAFAGAPPSGKVALVHATWALPEGLTRAFGPHVRAKMAGALLARGLSALAAAPVFLGQGGGAPGATTYPLEVEPGACYVALVAATRGRIRHLALRASVGGRDVADERGAQEEAAAIAFCARDKRAAKVEVEMRGAGQPAFAVAVHRVESGAWAVRR